jgi:pimeloyl-ACP methyl ester carboxylesterase
MSGGMVVVNGRGLYVEQTGPPDGQAVVLLHHGLGSTDAWKGQVPALAGAGYHVVVYDRWGYGRSTPRSFFSPPDFEEDLADLGALMAELDLDRPALLGHSDGGTIALYFAARGLQQVSSVVTVAAHVYVEERMVSGIERVLSAYQSDERFSRSLRRQHGAQAEAVLANWYGGWVKPGNQTWDMRPLLGGITCPVLVVQGTDDEHATPGHARDIAAGIPGAQLWLAEGARHMLPQEMPERFNQRIINFLGEAVSEESRYVQ